MKKNAKESIKYMQNNKRGITLVALVVTIVVLLILAGITITMLFGENGIIKKAQEAKEATERDQQETLKEIQDLIDQMDTILNGNGESGTGDNKPDEPEVPKGPNGKPLVTSVTTTEHTNNIEAEDSLGNIVVIPAGFKIAEDSGTTVKDGIVIEDNDITEEDIANGITRGNQFVWIPVSGIGEEGETAIPIKLDATTEKTIILGRYTFDTSTGEEHLLQKGAEYAATTLAAVKAGTVTAYRAGDYYYELNEKRVSNGLGNTTGTNTTAKGLSEFIQSVKNNHGYYIARYEASYGSGYNSSGATVTEKCANARPLSKVSTANSTSSMSYTRGTLWNCINQGNVATVARNMYSNSKR